MTTETSSPAGLESTTGLKERVTSMNAAQHAESSAAVNGSPANLPTKVSPLDVAKVILPDIFALADAMQWPIDGPGLNFAWFRGNQNTPSLNIRDDGAVYYDFVVDKGGGPIDLLGAVEKLDRRQACRRFISIAADVQSRMSHAEIQRCFLEAANPPSQDVRNARAMQEAARRDAEKAEKRRLWARLAPMSSLTDAELQQIIAVRRWPHNAIAGLQRATELGILLRCHSEPEPSYVVTDAARLSAKERRLDGAELRPGAKSLCLPGSLSRWPLGTATVEPGDQVFLVEGETDQLAMMALIAIFAPDSASATKVVSLAAGTHIHEDALRIFRERSRHVTVIGDADDAGRLAVDRWVTQLIAAGIPNSTTSIATLLADAKDISDLLSSLKNSPDFSASVCRWITSLIRPITADCTA